MNLRSFQLGASALAFGASVAVYRWLPERMPTHFDLAGAPNGWSSRPFGAFALPTVMLALALLDYVVRRAGAIRLTSALVCALFFALHALVLNAALTGTGLHNGAWVVLGGFFVAAGLVLPRVPRNRWVGVRTPWSMRSPEAWARSQRAGGAAFFAGGLLMMLSAAWSGPAAHTLRALAILSTAVFSIAYSYVAAKSCS
jgi:uncharacterized membrane protein